MTHSGKTISRGTLASTGGQPVPRTIIVYSVMCYTVLDTLSAMEEPMPSRKSEESQKPAHAKGKTRPEIGEITPAVVRFLQDHLGVDGTDLYYTLGTTQTSVCRRTAPNGQVGDPTLAILVRYYLDQPYLATSIIPPTPHPTEVMERLNRQDGEIEGGALSPRRFAILMGRSSTFPTYTMRPGSAGVAHGTSVARLLLAIDTDIQRNGAEEALKRLTAYAKAEMKARDAEPLLRGIWGRRKILRAPGEGTLESDAGTASPRAARKKSAGSRKKKAV